MKFKIDAIKVE